ncbi:MAG: hypothetical protein E7508_01645 [Ruminococcus sp.]|nr:hypothetical protein [Ruminococcus sp.]
MDIIEEIDETIKEKKREWNYRPMREKNETDALIDELLREFSSESGTTHNTSRKSTPAGRDYNVRTETDERREYENAAPQYVNRQSVQQSYSSQSYAYAQNGQESAGSPNQQPYENNEMTQVFSRADMEKYEEASEESAGSYGEYSGYSDDDYDGYDDGGFDNDYYDENDFDEDCENLQSEYLDDDEFQEFENYMEERQEQKSQSGSGKDVSLPKKIWRIVYTALIAAFAIIGVFSSFLYCLEQFGAAPDDKKKQEEALKAEIAQVVYPLAVTGVEDFNSLEDIPSDKIVALSIWEIIINGDINVFKDAETGQLIVPHTQVEYVVSKLFGSEKNVQPSDTVVAGVEIKYDDKTKSYTVPESHDVYTVYPVVAAIDEQDGTYNVSVKYYKDGPQWTSEKKTSPVKTMVYSLKKTSDYYNIISAATVQ